MEGPELEEEVEDYGVEEGGGGFGGVGAEFGEFGGAFGQFAGFFEDLAAFLADELQWARRFGGALFGCTMFFHIFIRRFSTEPRKV